jgi:beta-1,4-mannosyl-glycoprotein beta-1,4-N-acetylglucosaminyltransferase
LRWTGTKGCKKKDLVNPQWLRNIKDRKYSAFRLDTFFSDKKYSSVKIIEDGGWHFSNIKTAKEIEHKLKSYLHHLEFDLKPLTTNQIEEIIKNKQAIYDLKVDKRINKIGAGEKLKKFEFNKLPIYIQKNKNNFKEWID